MFNPGVSCGTDAGGAAASMEAKKMIVGCLIKRVEVYRDYKLHIDFNIDFEQFSLGMDIVKIAA